MKRVLLTNMYANLGGGELCLLSHIRYLKAQNCVVSLALLESGPLAEEAAALGVSVTTLPFSWQGSKVRSFILLARLVSQFILLILKFRPQILIAYTFNDLVIAGIAARLAGCPIVYRAQGELFLPGRNNGRTWLGRWLKPFFKITRPRIICTTRAEVTAMLAAGIPPAMVSHVYLGVDHSLFNTHTRSSTNDKPVVAIFGRLIQWKGQDVFLHALAELKQQGVSFEAWVVGGSEFGGGEPYEAQLHQLAKDLGIAESVKFLGFRNDIPELMASCDVVCHASRFEPFGMVVIEAMMSGKPVVASDVSGPHESVEEGVTGYLYPAGDHHSLALRLASLLPDPDLRHRLGEAGNRRAMELFDLQRNLSRLDEECNILAGL